MNFTGKLKKAVSETELKNNEAWTINENGLLVSSFRLAQIVSSKVENSMFTEHKNDKFKYLISEDESIFL